MFEGCAFSERPTLSTDEQHVFVQMSIFSRFLCPALSCKTYCHEIKVNPFMDIDPNQMEFFLWAACFALYKIPSDLRLRHFDDSTLTKWCDLVTHMQGHTSIRVQLNTPASYDIRGKILEKQTNRHSVPYFQKWEGCKIFHLDSLDWISNDRNLV